MQAKNEFLVVSLSFNSYSSNGVGAIASKVTDEFTHVGDFEFSVEFNDEFDLSVDQIQSSFPLFNSDILLQGAGDNADCVIRRNVSVKIPLEEIFISECEEQSENSSVSSLEVDETDQKAVRTAYCLWRPKFIVESSSATTWKKSRSTGQGTRRWKLRDLLRRSNSDGKGPFVFPISKQIKEKIVRSKKGEVSLSSSSSKGESCPSGERKVNACGGGSPARSPSHEVFYLRNRAEKEGGKRKSYLPYRQNIFAFFSGFTK